MTAQLRKPAPLLLNKSSSSSVSGWFDLKHSPKRFILPVKIVHRHSQQNLTE